MILVPQVIQEKGAYCMWVVPLIVTLSAAVPAKVERINLVDSGRVVKYEGHSGPSRELDRGLDGWEAWVGDDRQYMIGIEWDTPRELREVNIEFRHAIANREQIRVQYWVPEGGDAATREAKELKGRWVTAKAEWWAGDRDVTFAFVPLKEEQSDSKSDSTTRRTRRLRFVLGRDELPPVRYLRAFGPGKPVEGTFDLLIDKSSAFQPPLSASVFNGDLIENEDGKPTAVRSTSVSAKSPAIVVRYTRDDTGSGNRTEVTLKPSILDQTVTFVPAEAAQKGEVVIPSIGVTIRHRGGPTSQPATQPRP